MSKTFLPNFSSASVALASALVGIGVWVGSTSTKVDALAERVDALAERVDTLAERVDTLAERVDTLAERVDTLAERVDRNTDLILELLKQLRLQPSVATVAGVSPQRLTDYGELVADTIAVSRWAESVSERIAQERSLDSTAPDKIEEISEEYVARQSQEDVQNLVAKATADFGIDRDQALAVLRIELRDALLSR